MSNSSSTRASDTTNRQIIEMSTGPEATVRDVNIAIENESPGYSTLE